MFQLCLMVTLLGAAVSSASTKSEKIVGGISIDISQAPYQVSLMFNGTHICGGTIVGSNLIITAAHCFFNSCPYNWQIRAGSSSSRYGGELYQVQKLLKHPEYDAITIDKDIAVVWLSKPLNFSENIAKIDMFARGEEIPDGQEAIVTGWGDTVYGGSRPPRRLQMVKVPVVKIKTCKRAYSRISKSITPDMFCAGRAGKDSCQNDSGGPLVYQNKLAGVVSWGEGCADPRYPGVYAKVSSLRPWLDSVIN